MKAQVTDLGFRHSRTGVTGDVYRLVGGRVCDLGLREQRAGRRLPVGGGDHGGEPVGGGGAHPGQQVLVGVHRERGVGVSESFADDLD